MGLDMYLDKKVFVGNKRVKIVGLCDDPEHDIYKEALNKEYDHVDTLVIGVAYWRKAWAIHEWFRSHLDDVENCHDSYVDRGVLKQLYEDCCKVLAEHQAGNKKTLARKLIPDYDAEYGDWYYNSVEYTCKVLEKELEKEENEYYYRPDW